MSLTEKEERFFRIARYQETTRILRDMEARGVLLELTMPLTGLAGIAATVPLEHLAKEVYDLAQLWECAGTPEGQAKVLPRMQAVLDEAIEDVRAAIAREGVLK
jgi:hypothetical protein